MDKQISFLIPIYPPHYNYLKFMNKLTENHTFTIIFVLTTIDDCVLLKNYIKNKTTTTFKNIRYIILEEDSNVSKHIPNINHRDKGIINIKKLYGLYYITHIKKTNDFDYIIAIDSEIEFINLDNLYEKCKNYCDKKTVIAGDTTVRNNVHSFLDNIHINSISYIHANDIDIVNKETNNGKYYFWYSDLNIYDCKLLPNFFTYINFNNFASFIEKMNFWTFEYIIYYYYCIAHSGYKILCMNDFNIKRQWSLEAATYDTYTQVKEKMNYTTNIVIGNCYYRNKQSFIVNKDEPVLIYNMNNPRYNNIYNKTIDYLDN